MGTPNALVATLLAMAGQRNVITIPRAFVRFTGSLEAAMMLNQLLYWMPRAHGESIYKTDTDWMDELCLTRYAVRKARECLVAMGFLRIEVHHVQGAPAVHYHIDYDALTERWGLWLQEQGVKSENELDSLGSKVRKRTLPHESSSKTDSIKFENAQYINGIHRLHAKNGGGDDRARAKKTTTNGTTPRHVDYLIDQHMVTATEFADLDPDAAIADFDARRADGQSIAIIVTAWRVKAPEPGAIYAKQQPQSRSESPPRGSRRSAVGTYDADRDRAALVELERQTDERLARQRRG